MFLAPKVLKRDKNQELLNTEASYTSFFERGEARMLERKNQRKKDVGGWLMPLTVIS